MSHGSSTQPRSDRDVARAVTLAEWLDRRWLDPIIGLIVPGLGDVLTGFAGVYIVLVAVRRRLPAVVIARMLLNVALDAALGVIPVIGDAFDLAFRSNTRNARLLLERHAGGRASFGDWLIVALCMVLCAVALALPVYVVVRLVQVVF